MKKTAILSALLFIVLVADNSYALFGAGYKGEIKAGAWLRDLPVEYKAEGQIYTPKVHIYFPQGYKKGDKIRTIIALHGYNGSGRDWERSSSIERNANKYGFAVVCPDMGKTVYEMKFYPESAVKWGGMPGAKYIADVLIDYVSSNFGLARGAKRTAILGVSTGARGALTLGSKYSGKFGAVAGLSGDYDPVTMTKDRVLTGLYGEYKDFPERWENDASVLKLAGDLEDMPVFLAHGEHDGTIAKEQTLIMAVRLGQVKKGGNKDKEIGLVYTTRKYQFHDWKFWNGMLPQVMEFFDKYLAK